MTQQHAGSRQQQNRKRRRRNRRAEAQVVRIVEPLSALGRQQLYRFFNFFQKNMFFSDRRENKPLISRTQPASSQPPATSHSPPAGRLTATTTAPLLREHPRSRLPLLQGGHGLPGCSGSTILRCASRFCASCMTPPAIWTSVRLYSSKACLHSQPRAKRALNPASP
jgi:hypothetical protein